MGHPQWDECHVQILAFQEDVTARKDWKQSPRGGFTGIKPIPLRQMGSTQASHIPPWTTQGCFQALLEQQDPGPLYMPYRKTPGLTKGKVKEKE